MPFRYVDFAAYAYMAQAKRLDWVKIADLIKSSGVFNGMTFMLRNQWLQTDDMFDAQKWLSSKKKFSSLQNDTWFEEVFLVLSYLLSQKISVTIKLMDEYLPPRYDIPMGFHPVVHNTFGSLSVQEWYDSYIKGRRTKAWLDWDDLDNNTAINFRPANDIGRVHMAYFERMAAIVAELRRVYPMGRIATSVHNETEGSATGPGLGNRHEMVQYWLWLLDQAGVEHNRRQRHYVNFNATDTSSQAEWERMMKTAYKASIGAWHHASNFEVHNVGEAGHLDPEEFRALFGSYKRLRLSTDSVQSKDNNAANRAVFESSAPNIELKPEEKNWPGFKFNRNKLQKSVNFIIPALAEAITD